MPIPRSVRALGDRWLARRTSARASSKRRASCSEPASASRLRYCAASGGSAARTATEENKNAPRVKAERQPFLEIIDGDSLGARGGSRIIRGWGGGCPGGGGRAGGGRCGVGGLDRAPRVNGCAGLGRRGVARCLGGGVRGAGSSGRRRRHRRLGGRAQRRVGLRRGRWRRRRQRFGGPGRGGRRRRPRVIG